MYERTLIYYFERDHSWRTQENRGQYSSGFSSVFCIFQDDDDVVDSTPGDDGPFPRGIQAGGNVLQWEGLLKGQYSHDELRDCSRDDLRVIYVFPGDD
jgi:hypothetical protein